VIAWLLFKNEIVPEDAVIDAKTLPNVMMPNRDGLSPTHDRTCLEKFKITSLGAEESWHDLFL